MKKNNILMFLIVFLLSFSICSLASSPEQPYNLILEAFNNGNLERASHWISVTIEDFPESEEAKLAKWLRIPLLMANIRADVVVKNAYGEGIKTGLLDDADFYYDLITPAFMADILTGILSDENGFLDYYSNTKTYDFRLPDPHFTKEYKIIESELNMISNGLKSKNYNDPSVLRKGIKPKYFPLYLEVFKRGLENIDNTDDRARFFYLVANSIYHGIFQIVYDDLTADIMGEKKKGMYETGIKSINIALELTDYNPYSNLRADIEMLKEDYKDINEK